MNALVTEAGCTRNGVRVAADNLINTAGDGARRLYPKQIEKRLFIFVCDACVFQIDMK